MRNSTEGLIIMDTKTKDFIYDVSKREIMKCNISKVVDLINHMENIMGFKGCNEKLNICFSGYDDDPREIYTIPEIRAYMKKLVTKKPYIPYFITKKDGFRAVIMSCICDVEILKTEKGVNSLSIRMPKDMSEIIIKGLILSAESNNLDIPEMRESMKDMPF